MLPDDMDTFRLDLFPELQRTITRQGIKAFSDEYYSQELGEAYIAGLRDVTLKYDPRDLSRLYVRIPHRGYIEVPYRFEHYGPPPTLWLLKASRRSRVPAGPGEGEPVARRAAEKTRQIISQAASKSGAAARQAERLRLDRREAGRPLGSADVQSAPAPTDDDAWLGLFGDEQ
jgi:putative transposase